MSEDWRGLKVPINLLTCGLFHHNKVFNYAFSTLDSHITREQGKIIERIQASASAEGKTQIIYVGDGKGDYCPSLRLSEGDYAMPRKNFPVWDLINSDIGLIKAGIHEWSNGEEMERVLLQHIELPVDCKVQLIPKASSVSTFA